MVDFKSGPEEAAKMLSGLSKEQRDKAIENISKRDPEMAKKLVNLIVTIDDLQLMTIKMLQELLREISIKDLAMALRINSPNLRDFFLNNVSSSIRKDIEDILLGPPIPVSKAEEAAENIMKIVRVKIEKGQLVLNKDGDIFV